MIDFARPCLRCLTLLLLSLLLLSGCAGDAPRISFAALDFSLADAGSGGKLFGQSNGAAPACSACHNVEGGDESLGNSLAGVAAVAGERVANESAAQYLYWSIIRPGRYLVAGYSNLMYADYEASLEAADLADLIAYLLTLE